MASLPPLTGYNLGGIDQFWFIPVDDVQSIPDEESNVIEQDIQLVGDAKFSVGYATQETLQFTENQNRDAQGNFYEQSLSGFYPKDQENVASLFEGMAAERFIVIFRDNNGYYKLLGSLANPCKFTATFESSDSANGRNGYSFEFTRTDVEKAPFYQGLFQTSSSIISTSFIDKVIKFEYPPGAVIEQTVIINSLANDRYTKITPAGDVQSYTLTLNTSNVSVPFALKTGDTLKAQVTKSDIANSASLTLYSYGAT